MGLRKKSSTADRSGEYQNFSHVQKYFKKHVYFLQPNGNEHWKISFSLYIHSTPETLQHSRFIKHIRWEKVESGWDMVEDSVESGNCLEYVIAYVTYITKRVTN